VWNERRSEILRRNAQHYIEQRDCGAIEAHGLRFSVPCAGGGRRWGSIPQRNGPRRSFAGRLAAPFRDQARSV
jgi:hypothetical protein